MNSQFVDINSDGYNDIITGSFSGTPQIIMGGKDGYEQAQPMLDKDGEIILIADFWNKEDEKWDATDRCETEGHCTSCSAVDWDDDGDLDLLLGDYYGGRLVLRINEGSVDKAKFASTNMIVKSDGQPLVIKKGLAAPVAVDWNQDGLFDILCGGSKGGVFYFENTGEKGKPKFAASKALLEPVDKAGSFIGKVPAFENQPTQPGSSMHLEPVDYDGDGDLDLLVGARSSWPIDYAEELSEEEQDRLDELKDAIAPASKKLSDLMKDVEPDEREALYESQEYLEMMEEYRKISTEYVKLYERADPSKSGDFVWFFERK